MGRGRLADLQGLLAFLRISPWEDRAWWSHAVEGPLARAPSGAAPAAAEVEMTPPSVDAVEAAEEAADAAAEAAESAAAYERLVRILFAVGWRSSKATVDLALPSQSFVTHDLECAFDTCASAPCAHDLTWTSYAPCVQILVD